MKIRGNACYLDASALVKLATDEVETQALRARLEGVSVRVTSRVATTEVPRALARKGPESVRLADQPLEFALKGVALVEFTAQIASRAADLLPVTLRTLDAIHLASALSVGDELDALITYDNRLADAARAAGLNVVAPA